MRTDILLDTLAPGGQPVGRPFHVYDSGGEHLGSFTSWVAAHEWAHLQIALGSLAAPLDVEDRRTRAARQIWADRCALGPEPDPEPDADVTNGNEAVLAAGPGLRAAAQCPAAPPGAGAALGTLTGPPHPRRPTP
jgi:hypothetical protein